MIESFSLFSKKKTATKTVDQEEVNRRVSSNADRVLTRKPGTNSTADKEKKPRYPKGADAGDVYDDHADKIMHHLNELHKLTHGDSNIHKALTKLGQSDHSKYINDLHDSVNKHIRVLGGK